MLRWRHAAPRERPSRHGGRGKRRSGASSGASPPPVACRCAAADAYTWTLSVSVCTSVHLQVLVCKPALLYLPFFPYQLQAETARTDSLVLSPKTMKALSSGCFKSLQLCRESQCITCRLAHFLSFKIALQASQFVSWVHGSWSVKCVDAPGAGGAQQQGERPAEPRGGGQDGSVVPRARLSGLAHRPAPP